MNDVIRFRACVCDFNGELHNYYGSVNEDFFYFRCVALMNYFLLGHLDFEPVYVTFEFIEPVERDTLGGLVTDAFVDLTFVEQLIVNSDESIGHEEYDAHSCSAEADEYGFCSVCGAIVHGSQADYELHGYDPPDTY